jgi:N-acetylmuramoyl-L-alanine amidase
MNYTIKQGDCCASLEHEFGIPWKSIWNHASNTTLKQKRKTPDVLFPGDEIFIPETRLKEEPCATEKLHKFKKKVENVWLRLRLLEEDEPRRNLKYTLKIGDKEIKGTTDGNGKLEHKISPAPREAWVITETDIYHLTLGGLDPTEEDSGVEQRLTNLGFLGNEKSPAIIEAAVKEFQDKNGLEQTGEVNDATRSKLLEKHGS